MKIILLVCLLTLFNDLSFGQCTSVSKGSTQPQSKTVNTGSTATFTTSVNGTAPFSYFWYKNGTFITSTTNTSSTSNSYTTPSLNTGDNGNTYYCLTTNCSSSYQVQSNTATLTVNTPCTAVSKGSTQPQSQTLNTGNTATFTSSVNGTAPFSYFWYKNGTFITSTTNTSSTSNSYTTPTLTSGDNGNTYYCLTTNCGSSFQVQSNTATLTVNTPCTAVSKGSTQPQSQTVNTGNAATFSTSVNGTAPFSYFWYKNGTFITSTTNTSSTSNSYTTPTLSSGDNGNTYYCLTTNCNSSYQVESNTATLLVNNPCTPISSSYMISDQTVTAPSAASFHITATGTSINYQWQYSLDAGNTWNNADGTLYTGAKTATLTITQTYETYNGYLYRCSLSNSCTALAYSNWAKLTVNSDCIPISSSYNVADQTVTAPAATSFHVTATGTSINYQWQYSLDAGNTWNNADGTLYTGAKTATLTITQTYETYNGYLYRCSLSNSCTALAYSNWAKLTVNSDCIPISSSYNVADQTVTAPAATSFHVTATGTSINYQWQYSSNNGSTWNNADGGLYSGSKSATLTISQTFGSINGYLYRCLLDNNCTLSTGTKWAKLTCLTTNQEPQTTEKDAIKQNGNQATVAEPIQLGTGTYYSKHTDINIPSINGSLNFTRFYNSLNGDVAGPLGYGWSHTYNYYLNNRGDTAWDIHYPDGHLATFIPINALGQSFPIFSGTTDSLQKNSNDSYSLFTKEKVKYHFDAVGKLDSIIDLDSNITQLHYTGNLLNSIIAPGGRSLVLTYSGNNITSVKDPLNRVCNYTYDGNNNLVSVKDANNGTASFTYDSEHRMLTAVNPLGDIIVDNTYDGNGKVISQKDAYNQVTSIVYNFPNQGDATVTNPDNSQMVAHHDNYIRKTSETDELGFTKTFAYDANSNENEFTNEDNHSETRLFDKDGNLLSDTLSSSKITNITYNSFNSPLQVTDAKGHQKILYYNSSNNNLNSIRNPDNSLQVFYYNNQGQVIQSIDGNGNSTTYTYSTAGDLLSTQTFAGIKQFTYDAAGRKVLSTDENGHTTMYQYDNNDNIIKITGPLGRTIEKVYDANNQLLSVKDKKGFVTTYTYDKKGRKITSTNPRGGVTTYAYDVRDNLISVTDPDSHIVSYTYDTKGRKTSATNALGTTQYQYDSVGNLIKVIDPTNKATEYTYSATNKKQSQEDGLGNTTTYAYDANDNLTSVTDPLNRVTAYGYDVMNRLVSVEDAAKKTTSITYDKNGNKKTVVDPNGHAQTYNYDAANRMINYKDAAGNSYAYSYDGAGNIKTLTKPTGTIGKVYDAVNRTITVNNSTGDNYHFTYDNNDNIISMSKNAGTTTMAYDGLNQMIQYQDPFNKTVSFTYDKAGNKTSVIYPGSKTVLYAYDNANNLKSVTDWLSHTFTYTYDVAGRATQLLYPNGAHCDYGFDNAGRLTSKLNSLSDNTSISGSIFTLDAVGNRITEQRIGQIPSALSSLSRAYNYANDDGMLSDSIWNFVNDNSGNRTSETNGAKTASYTFSVDNLLNSWIDTLGNSNSYSYDPFGHRISKAVGANTNRYVLDIGSALSQILQITDGSGVVKSNYVYGLNLLESIDATNSTLYYHFDAQHNTTALTDQSGAIKDTYTYDPFGTLLNHTGVTTQPFTFLGEYGVAQESSSLFYARARYYDAVNGRFLSKDAFDYDLNSPQTINRYVYGINNPLLKFDYTGLYGGQDNYTDNNYRNGIPGFSYQVDLIGLNKYNDWWKKNISETLLYPIISPGIPILSKVNDLSKATDITNYINDYKNNEVGALETGLRITMKFYPDVAKAAGFAIAGPLGKYWAGVVASESKLFGKWLVNETSLGNTLTDYLASKYFQY